jgi:site-specific DNA recombinase
VTRAAIYARVSTDEQAQKFGLSSQVTELRALAESKGYTIPPGAEYLDEGHSGSVLERPALTRLREAIRAGAVQVVLVHDPDRLSRKLAHQYLLTEEIEGAGVRLEFKTTPREDSPEGQLLLNVKGVIGEYERLKIRERTMRGKREKARRGLIPAGPVPFGYRPDPTAPGRLAVHEEEARVVRLMFGRLLDDQRSVRKIAEELTRAGTRAPKGPRWAPATVKRLLSSEAYIGRLWFNRTIGTGSTRRRRPEAEWIPLDVPALIARPLFERAQAQLRRNRTMLAGRPSPRFYLLRGLLVCGGCGRRWYGVTHRTWRYYRCTGRNRFFNLDSCRLPSRPVAALEALIWETVIGVLRQPALLAQQLEAHRTTLGVRDVEVRSEAAHLERQLAALDRKEARLLDLYLDGAGDSPAVRRKLAELARRRTALTERAAQIRARVAQAEADAARQDGIARACRRALKGLAALDAEGRRQLLLALVDRVVIGEETLEIHGVLPGQSLAGAKLSHVSPRW